MINMKEDFDFIARLYYLTLDEGGRSTPAKSGYRPQLRFDFERRTTSGRQIFLDREWVCPGEYINAEITMLSPQFLENKLFEGLQFKFCEGSKTVGTGTIFKILNKKLLKTSLV